MSRAAAILDATAKSFIKALPDARIRTALARLGMRIMSIYRPKRDGKELCTDYTFYGDSAGYGGTLEIWSPGSGQHNHNLYLAGLGAELGREQSSDTDWLLRVIEHVGRFIVPKLRNMPKKEVARQAKHLLNRFRMANPPPMWRGDVGEGRAKDFFKSLMGGISIKQIDEYQSYWSYGTSSMTVVGHQIVMAHGNQPELYRMVKILVQRLRSKNVLTIAQLDQWALDYEGAKAIHQVFSALIEEGELEEGPSRGNWNFFPITGTHNPLEGPMVGEAEEQLPLFKPPASYAPGSAKKFLAGLAKGYRQGEAISSGRVFRRLVGRYPNKGVYIWDTKSSEGAAQRLGIPWRDARLVVVLKLPQGYGNPDQEWPIMEEWASLAVLKWSLRNWRNLSGSDLFINGVPAGKVSYRNPHLQ